MKNKKRDRTGEKYGEFTIVRPAINDKEWVARCSCGKERIVKNQNMSKLTRCNSCAARLRMEKRTNKPKKKKDNFTKMQPQVSSDRLRFNHDTFYKIEDRDRFYQPLVGKLINERINTATFIIIDWHEVDEKAIKGFNYRINVKKEKVIERGQLREEGNSKKSLVGMGD